MIFDNILGHLKAKEFLQKSIDQQNISHSYMFVGPSGIGKFLTAQYFAKSILCENGTICNNCIGCTSLNNNKHFEFYILDVDTLNKKTIGVDEVRALQDEIHIKPVISNKKVYIINNADAMTPQAQNCLLKTLEEPPSYVVFILIVANENAMLSTIKSRCIRLLFNSLNQFEISQYFANNNLELKDSTLKSSCGSISKALDINNGNLNFSGIEFLINNLTTKNIVELLNNLSFLVDDKENTFVLLEYMNIFLKDKLILTKDVRYALCVNHVELSKDRLKCNVNRNMCLNDLIIKMWEEFN